jgi:hypothetical protein
MSCKERRIRRRHDAPIVERRNRLRKQAERRRRDERMLRLVKAGSLPYTPPVMSWMSERINKPASRITPEDVKQLLR